MSTALIKLDNQTIRQSILQQKLQIFEVKQFTELENHYKAKCRRAIAEYKSWKCVHAQETDVIQMMYGQLEGIVLRHQAQHAVQAYWIMRQDAKEVLKGYLATLPTYIK